MAAKAKALDFTNVKDRMFNIKHLPAGDYPAKVTKVDDAKSKSTNKPMWLFTISLTGGGPGAKGASFPYYCVLDADNLWKVRQLFASAGLNIPKKRINIDPNKVVDRPIGVTLDDDEYEGKMKSVVAGVIPVSDIQEADEDEDEDTEDEEEDTEEEDSEDEEEPEPPKKTKKKKAKAPPADEDEDEELEELEIDEL